VKLAIPSPARLSGAARDRLSGLSARRRLAAAGAATVAVILVVSAAVAFWPHSSSRHLTAYFTTATGLYTGDRVLVLGLPVGQVESITPQPGRVKVEMTYDSDITIPAGAEAAIITPTLVTTRSIQLTPAYSSGPALADGATIPESRTAVPVEWDQIENELNTLATALGPNQKDSSGALNKVLNVSAATLNGQGTSLHDTITELARASQTLSDDRGNLFETIDNLQTFTQVLADSNAQVSAFEQQLASVSGVLADNKQELATALATLNSSLGTIETFVKDNRGQLATSVSSLDDLTATLAASDQTLANILQVAPTEVSNFNNIYDPVDHAIQGTFALTNFDSPAQFLCSTVFDLGGTASQCAQSLGPYVKLLQMSSVPVSVNPVDRDGYTDQVSSGAASGPGGATGAAAPSGSGSSSSSSGSGSGGLAGLLLGGGGS
jgi:phospholipid/cholesterol/gamma-HCH transport system substrate-binding protein